MTIAKQNLQLQGKSCYAERKLSVNAALPPAPFPTFCMPIVITRFFL